MSSEDPPDGGGGKPPDLAVFMDCTSNLNTTNNRSVLKRSADHIHISEIKKNRPPSESIQSVFSVPGFDINSKLLYSASDKGPFMVFISKSMSDPSSGVLLKALKFAQFMYRHDIKGVIDGGIKSLGRNKLSVQFSSAEEANNFVGNTVLSQNNFDATIPRFQVTRMGVVRDIPTDWSLEEFVSDIVTPPNCGQVLRARRLNFKTKKDNTVTWAPSSTVVLTFSGQVLPERVFCYHASLPVSCYQLPTIQCLNCLRFGHVRAQCRSNPRCFRCSQPHHGDNCDVPETNVTCLLCRGGNHKATDPKCPEHARQKIIKQVMSQDNISYREASSRYPPSKLSYADFTANHSQLQNSQFLFTQKSQILPSSSVIHQSPANSSHVKTVFRSHRNKGVFGKSFDAVAHSSIVNPPSSSQPNGCAIQNPHIERTPTDSPDDNLIEYLTCSLVNFLSKFNNNVPPKVLFLLEQLLNSCV
ncbi:hypothetical protein O3G_MSEX010785 [Manduca sexta]|uniref:CCHC-type domain-containing protein n=1 Tax=Manduca sexta TaxID=7130 RepID=A0A921ZIU0_MANSE|nr:hypothetical protein O3G_MSEX010785 [Manduca sexta]